MAIWDKESQILNTGLLTLFSTTRKSEFNASEAALFIVFTYVGKAHCVTLETSPRPFGRAAISSVKMSHSPTLDPKFAHF